MSRTNIDLDDVAVERVMDAHGFGTKRDAVDFALPQLATEPLDTAAALALEGSGWDGELHEARAARVAP